MGNKLNKRIASTRWPIPETSEKNGSRKDLAHHPIAIQVLFLALSLLSFQVSSASASTIENLSYEANANSQTQFGVLLANAEIIRRDFDTRNTTVEDRYGLIKAIAPDLPEDNVTSVLSVFFKGASYFPVFSKQGYFLIFYNPVSDVTLSTFWKVNGTISSLKTVRLLLGERLVSDAQPTQYPQWMKSSDFLANIKAANTLYSSLSANPTEAYMRSLERWNAAPANDVETNKSLHRLGVAALGLSNKLLPCGSEISRMKDLATLLKTVRNTNISADSVNRTYSPIGGVRSDGLNIRLFAFDDQPEAIIAIVADEKNNCKILYATGIQSIASSE